MPEEQKVEGRLPLRFDIPVSIKVQFEEACREQGKTMTEVIIELITKHIK